MVSVSVSLPAPRSASRSLSVREEKTKRVSFSASLLFLCRFSASSCYGFPVDIHLVDEKSRLATGGDVSSSPAANLYAWVDI